MTRKYNNIEKNEELKNAKTFGTIVYSIMLAIAVGRMFDLKLGIDLKYWFVFFTFFSLALLSFITYFHFLRIFTPNKEITLLVSYFFMGLLPLTFHGILSSKLLFYDFFNSHHPAEGLIPILGFIYLCFYIICYLLILIHFGKPKRLIKFIKSL